MSSRRVLNNAEHEWTEFELRTVLSLLCKGLHLSNPKRRGDDFRAAKRHAYLNITTELNKAVHGSSFERDISQRDVAKKIDEIMSAKGFMNFLNRARMGKITRTMRLTFQRRPLIEFDGSVLEWERGRKTLEMEKEQEKMLQRGVAEGDIAGPDGTSIEGTDFRASRNKRPNQSHYYNQSRAPAEYPVSLSYEDSEEQSATYLYASSFRGSASFVPPPPPPPPPPGPCPQPSYSHTTSISSPLRELPYTDTSEATEAANKFFDEMDREIAQQPSLASTNYVSTGRQEMIDAAAAAANAEVDVEMREESSNQVRAKGGNAVALPFNRLDRN